jgi:hypothetical protein
MSAISPTTPLGLPSGSMIAIAGEGSSHLRSISCRPAAVPRKRAPVPRFPS